MPSVLVKVYEKGTVAVNLQNLHWDPVTHSYSGIDCVIPHTIYLLVVEEDEAIRSVRKDEAVSVTVDLLLPKAIIKLTQSTLLVSKETMTNLGLSQLLSQQGVSN